MDIQQLQTRWSIFVPCVLQVTICIITCASRLVLLLTLSILRLEPVKVITFSHPTHS